MNDKKPVEHFTLEQVENWVNDIEEKSQYSITTEEIHTLLNAAINERIGEPVAWQVWGINGFGQCYVYATVLSDDDAQAAAAFLDDRWVGTETLYTLKEIKP